MAAGIGPKATPGLKGSQHHVACEVAAFLALTAGAALAAEACACCKNMLPLTAMDCCDEIKSEAPFPAPVPGPAPVSASQGDAHTQAMHRINGHFDC